MGLPRETVEIGGRSYRRFIEYPNDITDGTHRCIACGQIDDDPWHDADTCKAARFAGAKGEPRLTPGHVDQIACSLGDKQREVILSLSAEWGAASDHKAAKRLWYRPIRLVDHKHQTDNCWALTADGQQVREYLVRRSGATA